VADEGCWDMVPDGGVTGEESWPGQLSTAIPEELLCNKAKNTPGSLNERWGFTHLLKGRKKNRGRCEVSLFIRAYFLGFFYYGLPNRTIIYGRLTVYVYVIM